MAIELLFSKQDIYEWTQPTKKDSFHPSHLWSKVNLVKKHLKEMGIETAKVDIIENVDGDICCGSTRMPLLIKTGKEDPFVIKPYDCYNPQTEQKILKIVGGVIAPEIKYFGEDFYAEALIDHKKAKTLESIADKDYKNLIDVVRIGAKMHAILASMGINYSYNHWLDEFHRYNDDKLLITDFGTSFFFKTEKYSESMIEKLEYIKKNGVENFFKYYKPIRCFNPEHPKYSEIRSKLVSLTSEPSEMICLLNVIDYVLVEVKNYIELLPHRVANGLPNHNINDFQGKLWNSTSDWDKTMLLLPDFVESFASEYEKELSANRTRNT